MQSIVEQNIHAVTWSSGHLSQHKNKTVADQPLITCSKLIIETLEQGVKYVKS